MGMQQIILLALTVIIVGIAIVYGINAFQLNRERANMDALIQDLVVMGNEAQQWKTKPAQFGGQGAEAGDGVRADSSDYTGFYFEKIGRASGGNTLTLDNLNGTFTVELAAANRLELRGCNATEGNQVDLYVTGITDDSVIIQNATRVSGDPQSVACN